MMEHVRAQLEKLCYVYADGEVIAISASHRICALEAARLTLDRAIAFMRSGDARTRHPEDIADYLERMKGELDGD